MDNKENKKIQVAFSAIDPYVESNIVLPTEKEIRGQKFVEWGTNNSYPSYIYDLYMNVPTIGTIINSTLDYITGDKVISNIQTLNDKQMKTLVRNIGMDLVMYGGTTINVLRNKMNTVAELIPLDLRKVRINNEKTLFYYSDDFVGKKTYGRCKCIVLPRFDNNKKDASSIYYFKFNRFGVYPMPNWGQAVLSAETEKEINKFQYNAISNGMSSNCMVSFNNGQPTEEVKEEIEEMVYEKFTGSENAGRPIISFNNDKEHAPEVLKLDIDGFADRYTALSKRTEQQIFTSFRCNPNLCGINTEQNGFAQEQFDATFALYQKTVIQPLQDTIVDIIDEIYGEEGSVTIKPFSINFGEVQNNKVIENED